MASVRPDEWSRVRELFERALGLAHSEREAYLAGACGGDRALRGEVERMLDSHEQAAGFLSSPAVDSFDADRSKAREGQRIGPYILGARIGAGGMGEVYKARDTRLDRTVAIKLLPPDFAGDVQARERFVREGRTIAALNHPNICALYDVADSLEAAASSPLFLVMEHLEGETLADRLSRGALPLPLALQIGAQIAAALDRAHGAGVVHRDLKPGNVFLVRGTGSSAPVAKLLDFGLAKALAVAPSASLTRLGTDLTTPGTIVGTVQYMAPEQVEGRAVDARTDIFALGTVLHEMLTGTKAFGGKSHASLTVAILEHDPPPVSSLVPSASPALDRVVRRCLAKDPEERWQSARDLASEITWIAQAGAGGDARRDQRRWLPWALASAVAAAALGVSGFELGKQRGPATTVARTSKRFIVDLPISSNLNGPAPVLAPDGGALVYASGGTGRNDWVLTLYTMRDGQSRPLEGTEGANNAVFSPDGTRIGFVQRNRIRTIGLNGGPPEDLCDAASTSLFGASWSSDGWIVFGGGGALSRVSTTSCQVERVSVLAADERDHIYPHVLPGAKAAVFTVVATSGAAKDGAVAVIDLPHGKHRVLVKNASNPRFSPSGHLLFVRDGSLLAAPFDPATLTLSGSPVVVAPKLQVIPNSHGRFDVAADGTLAFFPGELVLERSLVWSDRKGTLTPLHVPARPYAHPALLPSGDMIVEVEATPHNLWRLDAASGALTLLTPKAANHRAVVSPDGRTMIYGSDRGEVRSLWRQPTDGSGVAEPLAPSPFGRDVSSWSRDGKWIAINHRDAATKQDIWVMSTADLQAREFLATPYAEGAAVFSPDSRWIAYSSDESGQPEVVVTAFPGPGPRKQVSTDGGDLPLFSDDGRTLYYKRGERIMAVPFSDVPTLTVGAPAVAFEVPGAQRPSAMPAPVSHDGSRVLYVRESAASTGQVPMQVVVNWTEELKQRVPTR
jgi:eukaryotic-like serine/threonine-protein kinase